MHPFHMAQLNISRCNLSTLISYHDHYFIPRNPLMDHIKFLIKSFSLPCTKGSNGAEKYGVVMLV